MPIRRYRLDFERKLLEVDLVDGTTLADAIPPDLFGTALDARSMVVDVADRALTLRLSDGREITLELGAAGRSDAPPRERRVVYLDQLHWVTLAQQLWSPEKVRERDRDAAAELIELARERRVVLPFAAAHLAEAPVFGKQRRDLINTVFTLSRGWQMRDPIEVRQRELVASLSSQLPVADEVITLRPDVIFAESGGLPEPPADLPLDWQDLHQRLTSVSALYYAMLEDAEKSTDAREMATRWARSHQELAVYMRDNRTSREHARLNARARLISDLQSEIARAAATTGIGEGFTEWLEHTFLADLPSMPYLGRLVEVLYERLRNADDQWKPNDLFDMQFLPCAAGYVDILVGEKKTSELLGGPARESCRARLSAGIFPRRLLTFGAWMPERVAHCCVSRNMSPTQQI